jgi:hypothetical protein
MSKKKNRPHFFFEFFLGEMRGKKLNVQKIPKFLPFFTLEIFVMENNNKNTFLHFEIVIGEILG